MADKWAMANPLLRLERRDCDGRRSPPPSNTPKPDLDPGIAPSVVACDEPSASEPRTGNHVDEGLALRHGTNRRMDCQPDPSSGWGSDMVQDGNMWKDGSGND